MKLAQVDKLYSGMTGEEKAAMAFKAIARQDDDTYRAILLSMKQEYFIGVDIGYRRRTQEIMSLSMIYGLLWFMNKSRLYHHHAQKDALSRLSSINAALVGVCERIGLDIEIIKIMAMCRNEALPEWPAPAAMVTEYTEIFNKVFE